MVAHLARPDKKSTFSIGYLIYLICSTFSKTKDFNYF